MEELLQIAGSESDDISEPVKRKVIELFRHLIKTVKARLVYPASSKLPQQFLDELFAAVTELIKEAGDIAFKIEADRILYETLRVYEAASKTDNFAHIFFRDGVTSFRWKKGITAKELDDFVGIISRMLRSAFVDDDLATLLWESGFEHVTYELMDDVLNIETFEYGADSIKSAKSPSTADLQKLYENEVNLEFTEEDFDVDSEKNKARARQTPYSDISDQVSEFIKRLATYDETEKAEMAELLASDNDFEFKVYIINLLYEILGLEPDNAGFSEALELIAKVRDDFIRSGDFASASIILGRTRELEQGFRNLKDPKFDRIKGFLEGFAASDRIKTVIDALNQQKDITHSDVTEYLKMLPWQAIAPLVEGLGELMHFASRRALCEALEVLAVDKLEILAKGIDDPRWYVVRNIVMVLGKIQNPRALGFLRKAIRHPDLRVRKETVVSVARVQSDEARDFLIVALNDDDERLQIMALKELVKHKVVRAYLQIERIVNDKKFKDRSTDQVREFLEALAQLGDDKALELLKKMATHVSLIGSEKQQRLRNYAVRALGFVPRTEALRLLEKIAVSHNHTLADTARRALNKRLKGA